MTQWNYMLLAASEGVMNFDALVTAGRDGWELVTIISRPGMPERAVFKRPVVKVTKPKAKKETK